jgi:hypothetical protein
VGFRNFSSWLKYIHRLKRFNEARHGHQRHRFLSVGAREKAPQCEDCCAAGLLHHPHVRDEVYNPESSGKGIAEVVPMKCIRNTGYPGSGHARVKLAPLMAISLRGEVSECWCRTRSTSC